MPVDIKEWFRGTDLQYSLTYLGWINFAQALQLLLIFVIFVIIPLIYIMFILWAVAGFLVFIPAKMSNLVLEFFYLDYDEDLYYNDVFDYPIEFMKVHTMVAYHVLRNCKRYFRSGPFILI